jgi:hypothetical protein
VPATSAVIYSPQNANGDLSVKVTQTTSGTCFTNSIVIERTDAFRCTVGNSLLDPCFSTSPTQVACPTGGPWTNMAIVVNVPSLPSTSGINNQGTSGEPWAIELADGAKCEGISGATNEIANQRLAYDCSNGAGLYGNVQRTGKTWMIYTGQPHSATLMLEPIATAWF